MSHSREAIGEETPIGHVYRPIFRVGGIGVTGFDVALVKLTDEQRHPITGCVQDGDLHHAGFTDEIKMHFSSGEVSSCETETLEHGIGVLKFGCSSGITIGKFQVAGAAICRKTLTETKMNFRYELHNQIECMSKSEGRAFAEPGYSGALVFIAQGGDKQKLKAIGIVQGGTTWNTVLLTPIWDVLAALGLENKLKVFPHGSIFDRKGNAESACGPPRVFPSSGSPTDTSQGDMMVAVTVTPNTNNNNSNNNSNNNNSDRDGLANVSRIRSELKKELKEELNEEMKDELKKELKEELKKELTEEMSELRQDMKNNVKI